VHYPCSTVELATIFCQSFAYSECLRRLVGCYIWYSERGLCGALTYLSLLYQMSISKQCVNRHFTVYCTYKEQWLKWTGTACQGHVILSAIILRSTVSRVLVRMSWSEIYKSHGSRNHLLCCGQKHNAVLYALWFFLSFFLQLHAFILTITF